MTPRRTVAIVPIRHDSERVPGKNYRPLNGVPLFQHVVATLHAVTQIDEIVIDTDSDLIAEHVRQRFASRVRVVARPPHLRRGETPMNDVLRNTIEQCPADCYLQTHSTNPLLRPSTISKALAEYWAHFPQHDSLFSVSRLQARLWWAADRPVNHDPAVLARTQDLPPIYVENSNIFIFSAESLRRHNNRIGGSPRMFEMDRIEAWDIDDEDDFVVAEMLHALRDGGAV
jgi:CMP-N-acetylneuraminic acid synthetase